MTNYNCLDGSMVENLVVPVADQNVTAQEFREDLSAYNGETYSGIIPLIAAGLSQTPKGQEVVKGTFLDKDIMAQNREDRRNRRQARFQTRMDAKTARNQAKLTTAEGVKAAASDTSTSNALASLGSPANANSSSATTKNYTIYYVIGGIALIGTAIFFLTRKK
jgi:hypothetical protein